MLLTNQIYKDLRNFAIASNKNYGEDILQNALMSLWQEGKLQDETTTISYIRHRIKMEINHFINNGKSVDSFKRKNIVSLNKEIFDNNQKIQLYEVIEDKNTNVEIEFELKEFEKNKPVQLELL